MEMKFKKCAACGEIKNLEDFSKPRREYCKPCNNRRIRDWRISKRKLREAEQGPKVEQTHKICKRCKEDKPLDDYYPQGKWRSSYCKPCCVKNAVERRVNGGPNFRVVEKLKYKTKRMGTTPEWFNARMEEQHGVCAICHQPETHPIKRGSSVVRSLAIDHDHLTGKVRGLLCFRCNTSVHLLDRFGTGWLTDAAKYLGICL